MQFVDLPIFKAAVGEEAADDEKDLPFSQFLIGNQRQVGVVLAQVDEDMRVARNLEGSGADDASLLLLSQEVGGTCSSLARG